MGIDWYCVLLRWVGFMVVMAIVGLVDVALGHLGFIPPRLRMIVCLVCMMVLMGAMVCITERRRG